MKQYDGPKKPTIPEHTSKYHVPSLAYLAQQAAIVNIRQEKDFQFLEHICNEEEPDYSGFNTRLLRESGVQINPKNRTMYRPLINKTPSDPSTVGCAMLYAVYWPPSGTVADLIQSLIGYIKLHREAPRIYLIFDRFFEFSPKSGTLLS